MRWNTSSSNTDRGRFSIIEAFLDDNGDRLRSCVFLYLMKKTGEINEFNSGGV